MVRHGEAVHNVRESIAQEKARQEALVLGLSPQETKERVEQARKDVLLDKSLLDAPLTEKGRQQAKQAGEYLAKLVNDDNHIARAPTEAMVSPLSRCLETAEILLKQRAPPTTQSQSNNGTVDSIKDGNTADNANTTLRVHIRPELRERQTQYPPDTPQSLDNLLRWTRQEYTEKEEMGQNQTYFKFHVKEHALTGHELEVEESKMMLRERASKLFDILMEMQHTHILIVSHKGFLREMERGLLGLQDSPLFDNAELRIYRVVFTKGDRKLSSVERLA